MELNKYKGKVLSIEDIEKEDFKNALFEAVKQKIESKGLEYNEQNYHRFLGEVIEDYNIIIEKPINRVIDII